MLYHATLVADIDAFLRESGMGESYFGKRACGNSEVVKRLRDGGRVWPETEEKIRTFMASHAAPLRRGLCEAEGSLPAEEGGDGVARNQEAAE